MIDYTLVVGLGFCFMNNKIKLENNQLITDVSNCARCGYNHKQLVFVKLINPMEDGWEYWSMCPELEEPILLKIVGENFDE